MRKSTSDPNLNRASMSVPSNQPAGGAAGPYTAPITNIKNIFKQNKVLNVATKNRFDPIDPNPNGNNDDDNDSEIEFQESSKTENKNTEGRRKLPPIVIHSAPPNHKLFMDELKAHI